MNCIVYGENDSTMPFFEIMAEGSNDYGSFAWCRHNFTVVSHLGRLKLSIKDNSYEHAFIFTPNLNSEELGYARQILINGELPLTFVGNIDFKPSVIHQETHLDERSWIQRWFRDGKLPERFNKDFHALKGKFR